MGGSRGKVMEGRNVIISKKESIWAEKTGHKVHSTLYNSFSHKANLKSYFLNLSQNKNPALQTRKIYSYINTRIIFIFSLLKLF